MKFKVLLLLTAAFAALQCQSLWAQSPPPSAPAAASSIGYNAAGVVKQVDVTAGYRHHCTRGHRRAQLAG
jgi:hypothetical protein